MAIAMTSEVFSKELEHEILCSERLRAILLGAAFAIVGVYVGLVAILFPAYFFAAFPDLGTLLRIEALLVVAAAYELLVVRRVLQRALAGRFELPRALRYWNAFLETSVPTVVMILFIHPPHPLETLYTPVPLTYFILIMLSTLRLSERVSLFTGAVAGLEFTAVAGWVTLALPDPTMPVLYTSFAMNVSKGAAMLLTGVAAALVTRRIRESIANSLKLDHERGKVLSVFGQHVSPSVVEALLGGGAESTATQVRTVCVMFLDIRDFTTFTESRAPAEVVAHLNALFDFMIEIVNRHGGIINKFLGDGFMAVFGAPITHGDDAANAVAAARELVERVGSECARGAIAPTRIGIGLHYGEAMTGTVGSKERREYTLIGDTVNVASRIESLNKQYGTQILLSEAVRDALAGNVTLTDVGETMVKGRSHAVRVYTPA